MGEISLDDMAQTANMFMKAIISDSLKPVQDSLENLLARTGKLSYEQVMAEIDKILKNVKEMCE
jgi:ElaB/YqjD/DUF883 family membrane-anchored ribosome-binding protein